MERHTSWESQADGLTDLLWQHKNLDKEDAEKDEAGTGHVVLERRQCSGSVLGRKRTPWETVDGYCGEELHTAASLYWDRGRLVNCRCRQKQAMAAISGSQSPPSRWMLRGLRRLQCTCWKPTCQARKKGSTPAGLSGSCLCPISLR